MNYRQIFNKIVAQLPVIGPHSGMEALLLAAGKKPVGALLLFKDRVNVNNPLCLAEHLQAQILDKLVEQEKLISTDITYPVEGLKDGLVCRHYAQPGKEQDLFEFAHSNALGPRHLDTEEGDQLLRKRIGDYLGYRNRDQFLWENILHSPVIPNRIKDAIARTNATRQHAYQSDLYRQIQDEPHNEAVKQILEIHDRLRTDFDGVRQAVIDDIAAKSAENTVPENTAKPAKVNFSCNNT